MSSEPDPRFESTLIYVQHICGFLLLLFNGSIVLLIVSDGDQRNRKYRKYLCCLQSRKMSSMAFDTISDLYSPIFLMHKGLAYSDSFSAQWLSFGIFVIIELICFVEVLFAYFACVYYRRCMVFGNERRFNFRGTRRTLLYIFLQVYGMAAVSWMIYFLRKSAQEAEQNLPSEFDWVRRKAAFAFFRADGNMQYVNYVIIPASIIIGVLVISMLVQLVNAVRGGARKTSAATLRYQLLAVRSLVLQGAVPSIVYMIPGYMNSCIQFAPVIFDLGERYDRVASVLSPICWMLITKHTFACSLTILYCSPSYRQKIVAIVTFFPLLQHSAIMVLFNGAIILLIIEDDDIRNKHYRKYLCCLLVFSLAFDTLSVFYNPIFYTHRGLIFSDSALSKLMSVGTFLVVEIALLVEIFFAYFACVYYRRSLILLPGRFFNYRGRRRTALFIFLQVYGLAVATVVIYFMCKAVIRAENLLPPDLEWARRRTTYLFIVQDENVRHASYFSAPASYSIAVVCIAMLVQMLSEVRKGGDKISRATRRYQRLAVQSLVLQGTVPSLLYIIPGLTTSFLQFAPVVFELGESFVRFGNVLSPILWVFITKHTFACSLTILYCSPSYRRKIVAVFTRSRVVELPKNCNIPAQNQR